MCGATLVVDSQMRNKFTALSEIMVIQHNESVLFAL